MTAPRPGDVVRIGDLPAGAVVELRPGERLTLLEKGDSAWSVRHDRDVGPADGGATFDCTARIVSLPDAPPAEESAAVAHWHRKATDLEAALARVTAERDEARSERDGFVAVLADSEKERARAHREMRTLSAVRDAMRIERDAALAQVAALQNAAAENGRLRAEAGSTLDALRKAVGPASVGVKSIAEMVERIADVLQVDRADRNELRDDLARVAAERDEMIGRVGIAEAECTRLRTVATGYATTRRDRDAVATICEALGIAQTPYAPTPDGALLAIRDLRAELIAHTERTQEAREMLASERGALGKICEALGMGEADDRTPFGACDAIARLRAEVQKSRKAEAALATICADLCTPETPYTATPAGALQAIADMQAETIASAQRANAARESWASIREQLDAWTTRICSALDMQPEDGATLDDAVRVIGELCEWQREVTAAQNAADELRATLATRDAQEGDRIAAWAEADQLHFACVRCWYPCNRNLSATTQTALCDACKGDDERASAGGDQCHE